MYVDTHVLASLALIASLIGISVVGVKLLREAMKRDADAAR
ncbi:MULTISPECIES: hypothetical protein [Halomonas]|uniref:Uncharacterized protein n=1 Tax=Halomonas shengliensis TaxID=419597 RepID=A0A1H0F4Q0_9GAMM|nr:MULTISPECIES: hypothetical protein [Halomonas]ERS91202.1 hypothetical protein Q671_17335 [Halomonas sp. PBN3]SDN89536.1 hypothetical protein SAMN04487957_102307 [Halomonas shengliensis]